MSAATGNDPMGAHILTLRAIANTIEAVYPSAARELRGTANALRHWFPTPDRGSEASE